MTRMTGEEKFLKDCNANRTVRIFGPQDYQAYKNALKEAKKALRLGKPFFASNYADVGYPHLRWYALHPVETAAWAVWVLNGAVRREYGSRQIENISARLQYTDRSYRNAWHHREWGSPPYFIGHDLEVHIVAHWTIRDGMACGRAEMGILTCGERSLNLPTGVQEALPKQLRSALCGFCWNWPEGVLEADCESIVRERAEKIAELLPAFALILVSHSA